MPRSWTQRSPRRGWALERRTSQPMSALQHSWLTGLQCACGLALTFRRWLWRHCRFRTDKYVDLLTCVRHSLLPALCPTRCTTRPNTTQAVATQQYLDLAAARCNSDPLVFHERGVLAYRHGRSSFGGLTLIASYVCLSYPRNYHSRPTLAAPDA